MHHICLTLFSCLGKYQSGVDKPDPKTWKANFRCAMNSLPDIEEVKDKSIKKGNNAFRVYRMLPLSERPSKKGRGESLWVWNRCWLHCYYGACIICRFCFYCKVGLFHPAVLWNLGTSLWKNGLHSIRGMSCFERDQRDRVLGCVNGDSSVKANGAVFRC